MMCFMYVLCHGSCWSNGVLRCSHTHTHTHTHTTYVHTKVFSVVFDLNDLVVAFIVTGVLQVKIFPYCRTSSFSQLKVILLSQPISLWC